MIKKIILFFCVILLIPFISLGAFWITPITVSGIGTGSANITSANFTIVSHGLGSTPVAVYLSWGSSPATGSMLYTTVASINGTSFTTYSTVNQTDTKFYWRAILSNNK